MLKNLMIKIQIILIKNNCASFWQDCAKNGHSFINLEIVVIL